MHLIESNDNKHFKELKKLKEKKYRKQLGLYIIEGLRFVEEAVKADAAIDEIIIDEAKQERFEDICLKVNDDKITLLKSSLFNQLSGTENSQGIIAVIKIGCSENNYKGSFYVLLDKLQDPGNVGTIIRTAHAAAVDGIIVRDGTVDIYNDKTLRSTMGSIFYTNIIEDKNLEVVQKFKEDGFKLLASSLDTDFNYYEVDLSDKIILVVGNEGNGVSDEIYKLCDLKAKIPMPGNAESLNASVAASIMIYEKVRQNLCK
ncbi:TrmH family RNA methyltransferase [Clostridium fungisolvens]|uniref:TrmH family tRNA/rRNA methyltransferase n=1 Tax=Clostridium fungisolvens TaxID=1604897 RepID=A0A6V8SHV9_9CLOT|nr:RNA methyltransferase [Clostridium fungisolvens]GFP76767.1 Putative TrmH family tRNA/rRNA methyltransferase [Clostridium fungisolvens]